MARLGCYAATYVTAILSFDHTAAIPIVRNNTPTIAVLARMRNLLPRTVIVNQVMNVVAIPKPTPTCEMVRDCVGDIPAMIKK